MGYRFFAQQSGQRLHIVGWARNRPDGAVEIMAQGTSSGLEAFERGLRSGPPFSTVDAFQQVKLEPAPELAGFQIIR